MASFVITIVSITGLFYIACNENELLDRYISYRIESRCYADVCNENILDSFISDSDKFYFDSGCCSECSCNRTCPIRGDCCPDFKPMSVVDGNIPRGGLYRCVQGNLKTKDMSNYLMISKCLDNFTDKNIRDKCGYAPSLGLEYYLPMYNNVTRVSYRNRYCAECNFESVEKLTNWELELLCLTNPLAKIAYSTLVGDVMARDGCNLFLDPPEVRLADACYDVIDTCNQTGLWAHFDPITADGCESYRSGYKHFYRNVFCYLCNKESDKLGDETCIRLDKNFGETTPALSVLFDFKADDAILTKQTMAHRCPPKTVYNPYLDVCNTVMCEHDFIYTEGECRPYFSDECMDAFLLFRPENEISKIQIDEICEILETSLDETLNLSQMTSWDIHKLHITRNVTMFVLHIRFIYDVDFGRNLTYFSKMPFVLRYNRTDLGQAYQISFDITIQHQIDNYHSFHDLFDDSKSEQHEFDIRGRGKASASSLRPTPQCYHTHKLLTLTQFTVCPWIELSLDDFNVEITNSITFIDVGLVLANKMFQFKTNLTGEIIQGTKEIKVCLHDFFANTTRSNIMKHVSKPVLGWLTSITSLVSIASCLLTVATYLLFPTLRTQPGINNMILSVNILFGHIAYIVGILHDTSELMCSIFGISLHLLWLSAILWYGVCSFHMFRVFNSTAPIVNKPLMKTTVRYTLFVTAISISFILVNLVTSVVVTKGGDMGYGDANTGLCWISRPSFTAYTITCPALLTVTCSMTLFVVAIVRIRQSTNVNIRSNRNRQTFLIYIKLSALTGITWLTIIPYIFTRNEIFNYLFIGLHGCNGLFLMMAFILNKRVFLLYKSYLVRTWTHDERSSRPTSVSSINSVLASRGPSDNSFNHVNTNRQTSESSLNSVFSS